MSGDAIEPGTLIAGKYRAIRVIGEGGMGVVVAARHVDLDRKVAIKLLRKDSVAPGGIERLLREARAAAALESPHVARVLDVGRSKRGEPYLVLELLEGQDLHARIANGQAVDPIDAVAWILQACEGLAAAHVRGIVHRDLKPSNLFLARQADGRTILKLLDFGLAKHVDGDDGRITATGAILGSPSYMSPEHLSGRPLDARSDVWSVGITLYELLANALPFPGRTTPEICAAVFGSAPVPLTTIRADVSPELERIIMECLEKDASKRPRDVGELAARLEPFAPSAAGAAGRVRTILDTPPSTDVQVMQAALRDVPTHLVSSVDTVARRERKRTRVLVALVVVAVAAIGVAIFAMRQKTPTQAVAREAVDPASASIAAPPPSQTIAIPIDSVTIVTSARPMHPVVVRPHTTSSAAPVRSQNPLDKF